MKYEANEEYIKLYNAINLFIDDDRLTLDDCKNVINAYFDGSEADVMMWYSLYYILVNMTNEEEDIDDNQVVDMTDALYKALIAG